MPAPSPGAPLDALAWLKGCWSGKVNQREFREMWLSPAGAMMLGVGQTVLEGKTTDYEHMRIEAAADGSIAYVLTLPKGKETAYAMTASGAEELVFTNPALEFPQRIRYHRGAEGWLYASAEGKVNGVDKNVVYPMRRVDCDSGELLRR